MGAAGAYPVEARQRSAILFTLAGIEHQSLQPARSRFEPVTYGWKAAASPATNHYVLTQPIIQKQSLGAQLKFRQLNLFFASPLSPACCVPQSKQTTWNNCIQRASISCSQPLPPLHQPSCVLTSLQAHVLRQTPCKRKQKSKEVYRWVELPCWCVDVIINSA